MLFQMAYVGPWGYKRPLLPILEEEERVGGRNNANIFKVRGHLLASGLVWVQE